MATIIGSFLQIYNKITSTWDTHYFTTHANAIIQTTEKQFISEELKNFIKDIKGDISGNYIDYDELTDTVLSNTNEIALVKFRVKSIEDLINLDNDSIISNLQEIIDFIKNAEISEGKTITEFVDDITKLKVNDTNPIGATNEISIYAPTNKGEVDQILVSTGTSTPQFKTIKNVVVKETTPSASDYGKTSFQGGEIWIDTGSTTPSEPTTAYNLKLVYNTSFGTGGGVTGAIGFYDFLEDNNVTNDGVTVPILYFESNEGLMALCIFKNSAGTSDSFESGLGLYKWNTNTNKYDILYNNPMFRCVYIYPYLDPGHQQFYGGTDIIIPGGRLVLNNENLFDFTSLIHIKPYSLIVVPS